ncbi:MAG: hypothetical protein A2Z29_04680 [Chloroflexi bacterium RBG_16_56_11]|nr:MAG: hypothetical protein A2Z29_04680 [Chloroflexi bacterium RBG_16_56_11]
MPAKKCPYCDAVVKDLASHKARKHPDEYRREKEANPAPPPASPPPGDVETLEIEAPEEARDTYHCTACGGPLSRGQDPCPKCGESLDWKAVNA